MHCRFPKDCWKTDCPHFHTYDLSVDDLVAVCGVMKKEVDICDEDYYSIFCPLGLEIKDEEVEDYE